MYERRRQAMDVEGHRIELIERQESERIDTRNGDTKYRAARKLFGPDGNELIPEGHGFYRTAFGMRFKLIE